MANSVILRPPFPSNSTDKELAGSAAAAATAAAADAAVFPPSYITCNPAAAEAAAAEEEIPAIDFSALTSGDPDQRAQTVRELGRACKEWGFFTVVNHGVPAGLRTEMMDACVGFFDLTAEEKEEYEGRGVMEAIRCGTSFNLTAEVDVRYWRDFLKVFVHPAFHSPTNPAAFRQVSEDYARHTRRLANEVLNAIWESLGLEEKYMEEALNLRSCFQVLVGNLYPPCPQAELAWGLPAHSDHGLLTLLMQNGTDGLQVMHQAKWVHVKPLPNSFLINLGDHMEIVSNGRYKSVLHRAKVNNISTRISVVTVIGPSLETVVVPAPMLVEREKQPAAFRGIKYGEFLEHQQSNQLKDKSVLDLLRL